MKKIISVISITIILLGVIVWAQIFAESILNDTSKLIDEISFAVTQNENINVEGLKNKVNNLDNFWTTNENVLCLVINHNDLNKIGEQIKKVVVLIEQNDKENCEIELSLLKFYTESYQKVMDIKFENLL